MKFELYIPSNIQFGEGKLNHLSEMPLPGKKAFVVISDGKSTKVNGTLDRVLAQLEKAQIKAVVYDRISANPVVESIDEGGILCKHENCDFVIALGGGSVLDAAKNIAILGTNEGGIWRYVQTGTGGRERFRNQPLPLVAIPTTAGTGSEVDWGSSFSKLETNEKISVIDPRMLPVLSVIDPELTYSVPKNFAAYQGWDALTHSMECLLNTNNNEVAEMFARQAVIYCGKYLIRAVRDEDYEARAYMALASALSGIAIAHGGVTSAHALECAISAIYPNLPHGAGLILLTKAYFGFFIEKHVSDDIYVELVRLLGKKDASQPSDFLAQIQEIFEGCGVGSLKMSDFGIDPLRFPEIISLARMSMGRNFDADRYPLSDENCMKILLESYS